MPSAKKLVIYFACGGMLFLAMAVLLKGRLVPVLAASILICVVIDGLLKGEIPFGQFNARRVYRRRESPVAYWCAMLFWALFVVIVAIVAFYGEGGSRTLSRPVGDNAPHTEASREREPYSSEQRARSACSTSEVST